VNPHSAAFYSFHFVLSRIQYTVPETLDDMDDMNVKVSFRKTSLVDYPGKIASVIFFPFCNLRCPWCHNGDLINGNETNLITLKDAISHIEKRVPVLGAVVLSGGEPLLYPALGKLISKIKEYNLLVKVDTNGTLPDTLLKLLHNKQSAPDYVALDLKASPARYPSLGYSPFIEKKSKEAKSKLGEPDGEQGGGKPDGDEQCGGEQGGEKLGGEKLGGEKLGGENPDENGAELLLAKTIRILNESGIPHEYRTVVLPQDHFSEDDVHALRSIVKDAPWHFHGFRPGNCLDPKWNDYPPVEKSFVDKMRAAAVTLPLPLTQ